MPKLTITTFLTLDGVMQAPGGPNEDTSGSFEHGGWVFPYFDDQGGRFMVETIDRAGAYLLGRKTYEIFADYWPKITDPNNAIAAALNRKPKYVASRTLKDAAWNGTSIVRDAASAAARLKEQVEPELQVHGSGALARALLAEDLVDELNLLLFPVMLGRGKRLFADNAVPTAFELIASQTTPKGVVIGTWRRSGRPARGSFVND